MHGWKVCYVELYLTALHASACMDFTDTKIYEEVIGTFTAI